MLPAIVSYIRLVSAYLRLNFRAQWEYRGAFLLQAAAMFVNNSVWVVFWTLFFHRFPVLNGWDIKDVLTIWAVTASGFGIAFCIFGNAMPLAGLIARGQLDAWMLYPRALLPHLVLGRMVATAFGDALFGFVVYLAFVQPDIYRMLLFTLLVLSVAVALLGFSILTGSLSFFLGNAEALAEQLRFALITFSTYPATLFDGAAKMVLYTLIPAGFVSYLPAEALKRLSLFEAALAFAGALSILALGVLVFYLGLRRYESGNLTEMRG